MRSILAVALAASNCHAVSTDTCTVPGACPSRSDASLFMQTQIAKKDRKEGCARQGQDPFDPRFGRRSCCYGLQKCGPYFQKSWGGWSYTCKSSCVERKKDVPQVKHCPDTQEGISKGKVSTSEVDECSSLAASRINRDLYWVNNDSGAGPTLYGIRSNGQHVARLRISGAGANDWEDIAVGPGPVPGKSYIYIADVGDNGRRRGTVQIYRVAEPKVEPNRNRNDDIRVYAERFDVTYSNGMRYDCEAVFIDQGKGARRAGTEGRVYLITKGDNRNGDPQWRGGDLFYVDLPKQGARVDIKPTDVRLNIVRATGADMTPRGSLIAVRTYGEIQMWPRPREWSVEEALKQRPCGVNFKWEQQGEAVAFGEGGEHYITVGEGRKPPVWYFGMTQRFQENLMKQAKEEAKDMAEAKAMQEIS